MPNKLTSHCDYGWSGGTFRETHATSGTTDGPNVGVGSLFQFLTINQNGVGTVDATCYLPANARIVRLIPDVLTAFDSATSASLTVGTASTGTQYMSSTDVKGGSGRLSYAPTAAQCTTLNNTITTNTAVYASVVTVGATTAGKVVVTVEYVLT